MAFGKFFRDWHRFHGDEVRRMLQAPDRKGLGRQAIEAATLFWRYRHPPVQYLRDGLYLKAAPSGWRDHIPPRFIRDLQDRLNPEEADLLARDKRLFRERMEAAGLPALREVFAIDTTGVIRDPEGRELGLREAADLIRAGEVFAKPIDGTLGQGAQVIRGGDEADEFVTTARNMIVQPRLRQHPLLARLSPHAVCTVRIDTLRQGDGWISSAAVLKVGIGESVVDNGHAGGLAVGIDLDSGRVQPIARQKPKHGTDLHLRHPDTGVVFGDLTVPHWSLLRATVIRAAEAMLPLETLGWDVAITEKGVVLVEADSRWLPDLLQIGWGGLAGTAVGRMACHLHGLEGRRVTARSNTPTT